MLMLQMCRKFKFGCNCHSGPIPTKYYVEHQCWDNAWTLSQCRSPVLGTDYHTTFMQCCLNVISTSSPNIASDIASKFTNIAWMLSQCHSTTLCMDVETPCCLNVVLMSFHNIVHGCRDTMLPECCLDVSPQCWERHCHNVHATYPEQCLNIDPQCWGATLPQYSHNVAWTLPECWRCGNFPIFRWNTMFDQRPANACKCKASTAQMLCIWNLASLITRWWHVQNIRGYSGPWINQWQLSLGMLCK